MSDDESMKEVTTSRSGPKNARKKAAFKGDRASAGKPKQKEVTDKQPAKKEFKPRQKTSAPVRLPQNLSSSSTPAKNDPFMGENVFASDYGSGGGVATTPRMYFANNYAGFVDLVRATYAMMRGYDRKIQTVVPECLFEYYCYNALWWRLMAIDSENGNLPYNLTAELDRMDKLESVTLPAPILAYLKGIGNYVDKRGLRWYYRTPEKMYEFSSDKYWNLNGHYGVTGTDVEKMTRYLYIANPFIYTHLIQCEYNVNQGNFVQDWTLGDIDPDLTTGVSNNRRKDALVKRTTDIQGYRKLVKWTSNSTSGTLQGLGWSDTTIPDDATRSILNMSPGTIGHISSRLQTMDCIKMSQATDTMMHNPIGSAAQGIYLTVEIGVSNVISNRWINMYTTRPCSRSQEEGKIWQAGFICAYQWECELIQNGDSIVLGCGWYLEGPNIARTLTGFVQPFKSWQDQHHHKTEVFKENFRIYGTFRGDIMQNALLGSKK